MQPPFHIDAAQLDRHFPRYTGFDPAVPVWCVTPGTGRVIHRFYDTSPFSPSGRYIALTRFPFEDRLPGPHDSAQIVLVDLHTGTEGVLTTTTGWDTQLGAQVQWGTSDDELYFNDKEPAQSRPFAVRLDPHTGNKTELRSAVTPGAIYNISPDGLWSASPDLLLTSRTQAGYGVITGIEAKPEARGAPDDDGLYLTNLQTGESRLAIAIAELIARATRNGHTLPDPAKGDYYGFHAKWNPQGTRLLFILRWAPRRRNWLGRLREVPKSEMKKNVLTIEMNGSTPGDVHVAIPDTAWSRGGHHPNWCPDGEHVLMNLNLDGTGLRFATARYDGTNLHALHPSIPGSGHPTMHPDARHILTDAYPGEPQAFGDGTIPIRLVDIAAAGTDTHLIRIRTKPPYRGPKKELRVDAHPAWDPTHRWIAFNACPDGTRRVFVADLSAVLKTRE
jgi:hypothetical protein